MLPSPVDAIVLETFFNTTSSIETTIKKQSRSSTAFWEIKKGSTSISILCCYSWVSDSLSNLVNLLMRDEAVMQKPTRINIMPWTVLVFSNELKPE
jgi:hypothetical protein